jgi:hypothetical protein
MTQSIASHVFSGARLARRSALSLIFSLGLITVAQAANGPMT